MTMQPRGESRIAEIRFASLGETETFAAKLAGILWHGDLILLNGGIGAGKTALVKAVASELGVAETVTSPTFVIHAVYDSGSVPVSHVDLYRLDSNQEIESAGFLDYMDSSATFVEWADRYGGFTPPYLELNLTLGWDDNERILTMFWTDDWSARLVDAGLIDAP